MFDDATDFRYITGANIDAGHPHGDLDRIRLNGVNLMPDRSATRDPLYGKDIAFLMEAAWERLLLIGVSNPSSSYLPGGFSRKLDHWALSHICSSLRALPDYYGIWVNPSFDIEECELSSEQKERMLRGNFYGTVEELITGSPYVAPRPNVSFASDDPLLRSKVMALFDVLPATIRACTSAARPLRVTNTVSGTSSSSYDTSNDGTFYQEKGLDPGSDSIKAKHSGGFLYRIPITANIASVSLEVWVAAGCRYIVNEVLQSSAGILRKVLSAPSQITAAHVQAGYIDVITPSETSIMRDELISASGFPGARYYDERFDCKVFKIYPVFTITHTAI